MDVKGLVGVELLEVAVNGRPQEDLQSPIQAPAHGLLWASAEHDLTIVAGEAG